MRVACRQALAARLPCGRAALCPNSSLVEETAPLRRTSESSVIGEVSLSLVRLGLIIGQLE